jgi:hypothetical protein
VLTVVEAFVTGGWDNLLVPVGAWGMIKLLAGLGAGSLSLLVVGAAVAVLALVMMYAFAPVDFKRAHARALP